MDLFHENGRVKYKDERVKHYNQKYNINITNGVTNVLDYQGYEYENLPIYSFIEVDEAYSISMEDNDNYIEWESQINGDITQDYVVFIFECAMGYGSPYPQASGKFDLYLNQKKRLSFTLTKYNQMWEENDIRFYFEIKKKEADNYGKNFTLDEWIKEESLFVNGLGYLRVPKELISDKGTVEFEIKPFNREKSKNWFRLGLAGPIFFCDLDKGIETVCSKKEASSIKDYNIYFGDIHTHSNESNYLDNWGCGKGSWKENFEYARDVSCLDFFCMSDHDWQLDEEEWKRLNEVTDKYNQKGAFVTIPGYEWTSKNHGHRNVYFKNKVPDEIFDCQKEKTANRYVNNSFDDPAPEDLWQWLEKNNFDAITIPHHINTYLFLVNLDKYFNEKYDRLVEIYSCWGNSLNSEDKVNLTNEKFEDYEAEKYLSQKHFGFMASSDGHDGNPGNANGCHKRNQLYHYLGSGKTAVLAEELSREAVFNALKERRCYAVTGAPIEMYFSINGQPMGSIISGEDITESEIKISVRGRDKLKRVELVKNGKIIEKITNPGRKLEKNIIDDNINQGKNSYYYVKVIQEDGEKAWSSPIRTIKF